jgi:hypothetical protein
VDSIRSLFIQLLNGLPVWPVVIALLVVSLLLIFAGRAVVKIFAFLVVGLIGASIGGMLGAHYLASLGYVGTLLGVLLGFFVGGLIGVLLVAVGIGLAVGYGAYLLTLDLLSSTTSAIVVGFIFFALGAVLYNKILPLVTAVAGGFLLYVALVLYGIDPTISMVLAVLVTITGIWVNFRHGKPKRKL